MIIASIGIHFATSAAIMVWGMLRFLVGWNDVAGAFISVGSEHGFPYEDIVARTKKRMTCSGMSLVWIGTSGEKGAL